MLLKTQCFQPIQIVGHHLIHPTHLHPNSISDARSRLTGLEPV